MFEANTIKSYLDGYLDFLKGHSNEVRIADNVTKITLPFLDGLNDCTEIYIILQPNGDYIISDEGETLTNLSFMGVEIKGQTKEKVFHRILNSFGVRQNCDTLYVKAGTEDLYLKKHMLLQCLAKINDMYMLNRSTVQNIFLEETRIFLDKNEVLYVPNYKLVGISGLTANYDFAVPKRNKPLMLIKTLNSLNKDKAKSTIFDWNDTKETSENNARLLVIYNDDEALTKQEAVAALKPYGIDAFPWSKRKEWISKLSA